MDQIAAYETKPDPMHYTTRFLDGLKPVVRVLVAIHQPPDLDTAYSLALLYEELGEGPPQLQSASSPSFPSRRPVSQFVPPPPAKWVSHSVEEWRATESSRSAQDDKWANLKAYCKSKGLCFTCGERWDVNINANLLSSFMSYKK
jgi:hypothetical protein